jgi:hypothetical protein
MFCIVCLVFYYYFFGLMGRIFGGSEWGYGTIPYVSNTVHFLNSHNVREIANLKLHYIDSRRITIFVVTSTYVQIELYVHTYIDMHIDTCT